MWYFMWFQKVRTRELRGERTRVVFEELYYAANNQKIADIKKRNYQQALREEPCWQCSMKPWQLQDWKDQDKSHSQSHESYMKNPEKSLADSAA